MRSDLEAWFRGVLLFFVGCGLLVVLSWLLMRLGIQLPPFVSAVTVLVVLSALAGMIIKSVRES